MAALVSMVYNGGPELIGPGLKHALEHENRAEAWFEIRYNTNGGESRRKGFGNGIASRRVAESDMFGLYNEPLREDEIEDINRMLKNHASKIANEERAFPAQYGGKNSIADQIKKVHYGKKEDDILSGGIGDDILFGRAGDDILKGGAGDDVLDGGKGKDKLYGGSGFDIYQANTGDTIKDSDNRGKIYFDATLLSGVKHKVKDGVYEDDMFIYTESKGNLVIAQKEDPSKNITVENWNTNTKEALGIELSETTVNKDEKTVLPESMETYLKQFGGSNDINNSMEMIQEDNGR